jgi:4-amino-4-deoxy-L-arabinose transferase-like glycosyltransferase
LLQAGTETDGSVVFLNLMKARNSVAERNEPETSFPAPVSTPLNAARRDWLIVAGLTFMAGLLRFWKLGHTSLWGDEINFVAHSAQKSFSEYLRNYMAFFAPDNFPPHLPLATLIEFVVTRFGADEFWGRFSAALLGTLTVPLVFVLGRKLFERATGLIAATLVTLSFFLIYYSREANYYSPLVFFSVAFFAAFWTQFANALENRRPTLWGLVLVWAAGTALLQTHLQAVFFVAGLGVVALVVMTGSILGREKKERAAFFETNFLGLMISYALCWPLAVPWGLRVLGLKEAHVDIPPHRTLDKMLNLPWQMGWGNLWSFMAPAAIVFLICVGAGFAWGFANRARRRSMSVLTWLIAVMVMTYLVFSSGKNGYTPHYVILILVPLLLVTASGMKRSADWAAQRLRRPVFASALPVAALLWLAAFEARPLQLLYQLPGKPTNWKGIAQWMSANLPPTNTVVYFDWFVNVWQHVPTYYKTPGVECTSTLPVGSADDMIRGRYRDFTRAMLEKQNDAAYLEAMRLFDVDPRFDELGGRKWRWPDEYFRHKQSFKNEPIIALDRLGLCPIGLNYTTMGEVEPIVYYNTPDDLVEINRALGRKVFRRFGAGFGMMKTQGYQDLRTAFAAATVELYNLTNEPRLVLVQLTGIAMTETETPPSKLLAVPVLKDGKTVGTFEMAIGRPTRTNAVTLELPPGKTEIQLAIDAAQGVQGRAALLVDDMAVIEQR